MKDKNNLYLIFLVIGLLSYIIFMYLHELYKQDWLLFGVFTSILLWSISISGYFLGYDLNDK